MEKSEQPVYRIGSSDAVRHHARTPVGAARQRGPVRKDRS
ncbi:hypothetical protein FHS54_003014 [Sphingobium vermicomposti]|uniref:Uncharacterized protein n=1 Tax=Sphingobium vermicomposti TaxID=529005 RepID=A0A846MCX0_9SPHN|nr:hypothetical protein [Sphingobium vermicomposti]